MSLYPDIRGALQVRAATASGFPPLARRKYEGKAYTPTTGLTWARMTLFPNVGVPASLGASLYRHEGLFVVELFFPANGDPGTGPIETAVDAVRDVFVPGTPLTQGSETLTIVSASRGPVLEDGPDWLKANINVNWRCFSVNP